MARLFPFFFGSGFLIVVIAIFGNESTVISDGAKMMSYTSNAINKKLYYLPTQEGLIANFNNLETIWIIAYLRKGISVVALAFDSPSHFLNSTTISLCEIFSLPKGIDCCASETCLLEANCDQKRTFIMESAFERNSSSCQPAKFRLHPETRCISESHRATFNFSTGDCIAGPIFRWNNNLPGNFYRNVSRLNNHHLENSVDPLFPNIIFQKHYITLFKSLLFALNFIDNDGATHYDILNFNQFHRCEAPTMSHNYRNDQHQHHRNRNRSKCIYSGDKYHHDYTLPSDWAQLNTENNSARVFIHMTYRNFAISSRLQQQGFKTYLDIKSSFYAHRTKLNDLDIYVLELMLICYAQKEHIHGNWNPDWKVFIRRCKISHIYNSNISGSTNQQNRKISDTIIVENSYKQIQNTALIKPSSANITELYYITTDEGLISHVAQLETILYKFPGRSIILLPFKSDVHYPDSRLFTLCDIFLMPENVTCCQGDSCLARVIADHRCVINADAADWARDPGLYNLHPNTPVIDFRIVNESAKDSIACIAGFFMSGLRIQFPIIFRPHIMRTMEMVLEKLQFRGIDEFDVFHWRRGDQLATRCKSLLFKDQSPNCESVDKLIEYIRSFANSSDANARIPDMSRVYVATNEQNATMMEKIHTQGFRTGAHIKSILYRDGILLGTLDLFVLELALMCFSRKTHLLGRSGINSFVTRCRLKRFAEMADSFFAE